jgi:hypothetical protein
MFNAKRYGIAIKKCSFFTFSPTVPNVDIVSTPLLNKSITATGRKIMAENKENATQTLKGKLYSLACLGVFAATYATGLGHGMATSAKEGVDCSLDRDFIEAATAQIASGDLSVKVATNQDGQCRLKVTTAQNGYMP